MSESRVIVGDPAAPAPHVFPLLADKPYPCFLDLSGLVGQAQLAPGASLTLRSLVAMNLGPATAPAAPASVAAPLANFTSMLWLLLGADRRVKTWGRARVCVWGGGMEVGRRVLKSTSTVSHTTPLAPSAHPPPQHLSAQSPLPLPLSFYHNGFWNA